MVEPYVNITDKFSPIINTCCSHAISCIKFLLPIDHTRIFFIQLKSYAKDNRLLGVDESSRGYSCYFYKHNKTEDCCIAGQAAIFQQIRISASVCLILLIIVYFVGVAPYICTLYDKLLRSVQQSNSDALFYAWAICITAFLVETTVFGFYMSVIIRRYNEAKDERDVRFYYVLTCCLLIALPILDLIYAVFMSVQFKLKDKLLKYNCSAIFLCHSKNGSFIITCIGITTITYILQQSTLCGYMILLAAIASPLHTCPLFLFYVSGLFLFVVIIAILLKALHKHLKMKILLIFVVLIIIVTIFIAFIYTFISFIKLVGSYSSDDGILSVVGALLPTLIFTSLGLLVKRSMKLLGLKESTTNQTTQLGESYQCNQEYTLQPVRLRKKNITHSHIRETEV